jgi:aminobenzoyl-glutamate utilization protein B
MLSPEDKPAIHRNDELMSRMRPRMEPYYYDSAKHGSYLEQLGVAYPPPSDAAGALTRRKTPSQIR